MLDLANPTVVQQSGSLYDPAVTNPNFYLYNSIMTNSNGDVLVGSTRLGKTERINATASLLLDNASNFDTILYTNSTTNFNPTDDIRTGGRYRWGDYSLVTIDPNDTTKFWVIEMYCSQTDTWGVEVAEVSVR